MNSIAQSTETILSTNKMEIYEEDVLVSLKNHGSFNIPFFIKTDDLAQSFFSWAGIIPT